MFRKHALGGKVAGSTKTVDIGGIGFEMRCVLYNVGAAHSRLAAAQDRSPPLTTSNTQIAEGSETSSNTALKIACTHLQCAAWAFEVFLCISYILLVPVISTDSILIEKFDYVSCYKAIAWRW